MPAAYPQFIPQPFAQNAAGSDRNAIPNAPIGTQRASFNLGFPPLVMTPVVAGGKPMLGPDMNGVLYMMSSHTVYQQSGQPYRYSSAVSTAIGGYAVGTLLGSTDGLTLWYNITAANTTDPDAGGAGWVAMYSYGISSISGLTGSLRTLTPAEASKSVIILTGTLVSNQQIVLPTQLRRWLIVNATTGAFQLTVKTAAGTGVAVPQGGLNAPVEVWGDGTNIYNVVAPFTVPTDQNPTALTIPQRTNAGYLLATYFNQNSGLENFAMSAIFAEQGSDGFHRKITPANVQAQMSLSLFPGQVTNAQVPQSAVTQHAAAILLNAALTGTPTTPTAALGTSNSQVASTAFANPGSLLSSNGWYQFPGGLIIQWGTATGAAGAGTYSVAFPRTFPSQCFTVVGSLAGRTTNAGGNTDFSASSINAAGFTAYSQDNNGGARSCNWIAVGN